MDIINDGYLWKHIIKRIQQGFGGCLGCGHNVYTDGSKLFVEDEVDADVIADFLEMMGFDVYTFECEDPKNEYNGFYCIDVE